MGAGRWGWFEFQQSITGVMAVSEKRLLSFQRITGHFTEKGAGFSPALAPYNFKYVPHGEDFLKTTEWPL